MSLLKKGYIRTHIYTWVGMIELHADFFFQWQAKYHYTSKSSGTMYALLK